MKRVLILGIGGMDGSHLADNLLNGYRLTNALMQIDRLLTRGKG